MGVGLDLCPPLLGERLRHRSCHGSNEILVRRVKETPAHFSGSSSEPGFHPGGNEAWHDFGQNRRVARLRDEPVCGAGEEVHQGMRNPKATRHSHPKGSSWEFCQDFFNFFAGQDRCVGTCAQNRKSSDRIVNYFRFAPPLFSPGSIQFVHSQS